eukprot:c16838_g1_i2.p1 GENE.c16838_g1_i2~~c16838_g1_i2.p1  ORF type:complete len:444 (+),score=22.76 c16838_g1_i2:1-1332(+)
MGKSECHPAGEGAKKANAGLAASFLIRLADICGNMQARGGDKVIAELVGPAGVSGCEVIDQKDGSYKVVYIPPAEGNHTMHLALQHNNSAQYKQYLQSRETALSTAKTLYVPPYVSSPAAESVMKLLTSPGLAEYKPMPPANDVMQPVQIRLFDPFTISVTGGASANTTTASGDGLNHAVAGVPATFTVTTRDSSNQLIGQGGLASKISVDVIGPNGKGNAMIGVANVDDKGDGTYLVTYVPVVSGANKLVVKLSNNNIQNSPFPLTVTANSSSAGHCTASGAGLTDAAAKIPAVITVTARDAYGNQRPSGGDKFALQTTPQLSQPATIIDNNDGTFTITYTPDAAGPLQLNVVKEDEDSKPIKDMPVNLKVMTPPEIIARNKALFDLLKELKQHRDGIQNAVDSGNAHQCDCGAPTNVKCPSCQKTFNAKEWLISRFGSYWN